MFPLPLYLGRVRGAAVTLCEPARGYSWPLGLLGRCGFVWKFLNWHYGWHRVEEGSQILQPASSPLVPADNSTEM